MKRNEPDKKLFVYRLSWSHQYTILLIAASEEDAIAKACKNYSRQFPGLEGKIKVGDCSELEDFSELIREY